MCVETIRTESPVRNAAALKGGEKKTRLCVDRLRNVNRSFSPMCLLLKSGSSPSEANPRRQLSGADTWQPSRALALNHHLHPQPSPARPGAFGGRDHTGLSSGDHSPEEAALEMRREEEALWEVSPGPVRLLSRQQLRWLWCSPSPGSYVTFARRCSDPAHLFILPTRTWQEPRRVMEKCLPGLFMRSAKTQTS